MNLVAFSDWRSQKISLLIKFLRKLEIKPDLILYAGDDILKFNLLFYGRFLEEIEQKLSSTSHEDDIILLGEKVESLRTGDDFFTNMQENFGWNNFEELAKYSKKGICVVAGNDDLPLLRFGIEGKNVFNVHEAPFIIDKNYAIIGLEGSTGEIGSLLYTENEIETHLKNMLKRIGNRKIIILSHSPPYETLDFAIRFGKRHIGSKALQKFINIYYQKIVLVVCGHVHLQGGKDEKYQGVSIVNCASHDGEYQPGRVAQIELQDNKVSTTWELLQDIRQNLMRIYHISYKRADILIEHGITSIEEFYRLPQNHAVTSHPSFKGSFKLLQMHAEALVKEDIIIKKRKKQYYKSLVGKSVYFFDAEYDPQRTSTGPYGIFLLGWMDLEGNVHQLFLDKPNHEKKMINEFIQWIGDNQPCFVAYDSTAADLPHLKNTCKRLKIDPLYLNNLFSDYFRGFISTQSIKRQEIFFPLSNLKLKNLSNFIGYPKIDIEIDDGLMALYKYEKYLETKNKVKKTQLKKDLLEYNEEDLKRLAFLYKKIQEDYF